MHNFGSISAYCVESSPEQLPLHVDFQRHSRAFFSFDTSLPTFERFADVIVLINKLE